MRKHKSEWSPIYKWHRPETDEINARQKVKLTLIMGPTQLFLTAPEISMGPTTTWLYIAQIVEK